MARKAGHSALLKKSAPSMCVRVAQGCAIDARDDHAPSLIETYCAGDIIPDLDASTALALIAAGIVEPV